MPESAEGGGVIPSSAWRRASSSALVGKSLGPLFLTSSFFFGAALPAFIASNSALVGNKRRGFGAAFLAVLVLDFVADFLAAVFLTAFLTAIFRKPQLH